MIPLRAPAVTAADAPVPKTQARTDIFAAGEVLSNAYEILHVLGAGGMGQVFEAHDLALDRRLAIKAAWPGATPGQLRAEARAMAAVKHPCVPAVYAVSIHREIEYVAMERLYGVALADHIAQRTSSEGSFEIAEVVSLMRSMADALAAVHRAGIAHHDVKPENVMLAAGGRVVLLDLGIVLPEVNVGDHATVEGSPAYMAPEVITGTTRPGMARLGDLYALGVIGFELLTGSLPFEGTTALEIWGRHLTEAPPDVRIARPEVPDALAELVGELLAKDPAARPQSAESVAWSLGAIETRRRTRSDAPGFDVLIVDDDVAVVDVEARMVRDAVPDAVVRRAHDGQAAITAVRAHEPRLMLVDIDMPRMNGIEVCMYLRGMGLAERTTVVAVSGTADVHDRALLRELGVVRFVSKDPDDLERLTDIAREARASA